MNVLDTSSNGDRPICQIWYANVKANRSYRSYMKTWKKPLNLTLRSKFKVVSGSWINATHRLMVIHPCAKYGKSMSNHKKVMGRTRICTDRRTDRQTDGQTDRQTDRRTEWFLYTPLNLVRGGYNKEMTDKTKTVCHPIFYLGGLKKTFGD